MNFDKFCGMICTAKTKSSAALKLLFTANEACEVLAVSRRTLSRLIRAGSLKPHRRLRTLRFTREELESFAGARTDDGVQIIR